MNSSTLSPPPALTLHFSCCCISVEVMIFGGANEQAVYNNSMVAGRKSYRIAVNPTATGSYTFGGGWSEEDMGFARVMPDGVLLPNGQIVILNGAQVGTGGPLKGGPGLIGEQGGGGGVGGHHSSHAALTACAPLSSLLPAPPCPDWRVG